MTPFRNQKSFLFTAIGASVGVGNVLRFPSLCVQYGGNFLFLYALFLFLLGVPLLHAELQLGADTRLPTVKAFATLHVGASRWGLGACLNSLQVTLFYSVMVVWLFGMAGQSGAIAQGKMEELPTLFSRFADFGGTGYRWQLVALLALCWVLLGTALFRGTAMISKIATLSVLFPIAFLLLFALCGLCSHEGGQVLQRVFLPNFFQLYQPQLWVQVLSQVLFSLSVLVGVMPTYGAKLPQGVSTKKCAVQLALADLGVSVLASLVLTWAVCRSGWQDDLPSSPYLMAFTLYPVALRCLFQGRLCAIVALCFYGSVGLMALSSTLSLFEVAEGVFGKHLLLPCLGFALSLTYLSGWGNRMIEVSDQIANNFNLLLLGVGQCLFLQRTPNLNRWEQRTIGVVCPCILGVLALSAACSLWAGEHSLWQILLSLLFIAVPFVCIFLQFFEKIFEKCFTKSPFRK